MPKRKALIIRNLRNIFTNTMFVYDTTCVRFCYSIQGEKFLIFEFIVPFTPPISIFFYSEESFLNQITTNSVSSFLLIAIVIPGALVDYSVVFCYIKL